MSASNPRGGRSLGDGPGERSTGNDRYSGGGNNQ